MWLQLTSMLLLKIEGENVREENYQYRLSENKRYKLRAINQLAIGSIITLWGSLLALKQVGIIEKNISTWPFAFVAFGILLVVGGVYRLYAKEQTANAESR
jgi:hypothetical protein